MRARSRLYRLQIPIGAVNKTKAAFSAHGHHRCSFSSSCSCSAARRGSKPREETKFRPGSLDSPLIGQFQPHTAATAPLILFAVNCVFLSNRVLHATCDVSRRCHGNCRSIRRGVPIPNKNLIYLRHKVTHSSSFWEFGKVQDGESTENLRLNLPTRIVLWNTSMHFLNITMIKKNWISNKV